MYLQINHMLYSKEFKSEVLKSQCFITVNIRMMYYCGQLFSIFALCTYCSQIIMEHPTFLIEGTIERFHCHLLKHFGGYRTEDKWWLFWNRSTHSRNKSLPRSGQTILNPSWKKCLLRCLYLGTKFWLYSVSIIKVCSLIIIKYYIF